MYSGLKLQLLKYSQFLIIAESESWYNSTRLILGTTNGYLLKLMEPKSGKDKWVSLMEVNLSVGELTLTGMN